MAEGGGVRTWKETDQARGTHSLETVEGGSSQSMESNRQSKGHLLPGDSRGRHKSGHGKKQMKQGALTNWRPQGEGQVRTQKETDQVRGTHILETAAGGTSQDTERN